MLGMQFCRLDVMMSRMLTVPVSQVRVMGCLFVLLGQIVFRCFVEMVIRFLVMTSGVMAMFPSL